MKLISRYLKKYKRDIIISPLAKIIETATDLIIPFLVALMIDVGIANKDLNYILILGAVIVVLNVVGIISALVCAKLAVRASVNIGKEMRSDLYAKINTLSHVELDRYSTATLNNRITHDVERVQDAISKFIRQVTRAPFLIIGALVMALTINAQLSLIFLVVAPLVLCAVIFIMKATTPLYSAAQKKLDKVGDITRENLQGSRVIRAFNRQEDEEVRFGDATTMLAKSSIKVTGVTSMLSPLTNTIINLSIVAVLWFGGVQVNIGGLSGGQIIAFINYLMQISTSLISIANLMISFVKAKTCAGRISEIMDIEPAIKSANEMSSVLNFNYKIQFNDVSFGYGNAEQMTIKNLSLNVEIGQTIGIIGGTGSGKSTVINLIPRFYDVTQGAVLVDGIDVKGHDIKTLRSKIGLVPQKSVLFSGTLRENMQWRKFDATDEEILTALEIAQAMDFINELDNKLDFMIQAGGQNLSGGQRQRLCIARALVGMPEILILDDSASALDFATDYNLRKAIKNLKSKITVFLISQRVNSLKFADNIVVLEHGDVVAIDKHANLVKTCAIYKEIAESQKK